jgi:hypothetical protein
MLVLAVLEFGLELGLLSFRSPLPIRASQQLRQLRDIYHNHLVAHEQFDY